METYVGKGVQTHIFFFCTTRWGLAVSFTSQLLYPCGKRPHTNCMGGCVGSRRISWRNENSWHYWNSESDPLIIQPRASCYSNCATLGLICWWSSLISFYIYLVPITVISFPTLWLKCCSYFSSPCVTITVIYQFQKLI
jgi:hypothetical protein